MMGLFGLFDRRASLENPAVPITSATLVDWLGGGISSDAGVRVTETGSLKMSAVYRAVSLISGLGGALPLHVYARGSRELVGSALLENPHPDLTPCELWGLSYVHRFLWGDFVAQKVRNGGGQVQWLYPIAPARVRFGKARPIEANPSGKVFEVTQDDGTQVVLTPNEVLHIPGLSYDGVKGVSVVKLAAQGIGTALAAEKHSAKLFGSGNLLSGLLKTTQRLNQDQADALQTRWRAKMAGISSSHEIAVLDSGAEFQSLTMPNDDAQLLETRHFQISELSRFSGVPPFLLMETEKSTSWGTGLEQQASGFVRFDLHPRWLAPTEQRVTRDLLPRNRYAKYKVEGLLRGDSIARAQFYTAMRNAGVMNADEIRDLEDLPPIPGGLGQTFLQPLNMAPLGSDTNPDEGGSDAPQPAE